MTMVHLLRNQAIRLAQVAGTVLGIALAWLGTAAWLPAQGPPVHYQHAGALPPGAIGSQQLLRGGPLPGYFQPVEIRVPQGTRISLAVEGRFDQPEDGLVQAGMLIGSVYRLRVTNIPLQEGLEVFPTIEVVDRIYPPLGQEFKFPIPIELTQEELEMALTGKFVTRVIYLEDPENSLPIVEDPRRQSYFEAPPGENPLEVADHMGRPMAILRMGARLPDAGEPDNAFLYGSPPLLRLVRADAEKTSQAPAPRPAAKGAARTATADIQKPERRGAAAK